MTYKYGICVTLFQDVVEHLSEFLTKYTVHQREPKVHNTPQITVYVLTGVAVARPV